MGECPGCHIVKLINKHGYCDDCQKSIDWFFSIPKDTPFLWRILFYFIFLLTTVMLIGIGTVSLLQYLF